MTDPTDRAAANSADAPIADLSFDDALAALQKTVAELEAGGQPLERSIALYERGQALKVHCEQKLRSAESRLEKIVPGPKGAERAEPLNLG